MKTPQRHIDIAEKIKNLPDGTRYYLKIRNGELFAFHKKKVKSLDLSFGGHCSMKAERLHKDVTSLIIIK